MTSAKAALKEKHFTFAAGGDLFLKGRIGFDFLKSDFSNIFPFLQICKDVSENPSFLSQKFRAVI